MFENERFVLHVGYFNHSSTRSINWYLPEFDIAINSSEKVMDIREFIYYDNRPVDKLTIRVKELAYELRKFNTK